MTGVLKSLRDYHKQEPKKKKPPVETKKATPVASKPSPASSTPSKPKASSGASTASKTKVASPPDRPVSSNRAKAGGARPEGPAAGMPAKRRGSIKIGPVKKAVVGSGRISNEVGDGPAGKRKKKKSGAKTRAGTSY